MHCAVHQLEEDGIVFLTPMRGSSAASSDHAGLQMVMPFLWLHVLHVRYGAQYHTLAVQMPLVRSLTCQMSPAQDED